MSPQIKKLVRIAMVLTLVVIIALTLSWASKQSSIEIIVNTEDKASEVAIYLNSGSDKHEFRVKPGESETFKMTRDVYQLYAQQNSQAYLNSVILGGFFKTTKVELTLKPETNRAFLGDNPSECPLIMGELLVGTSCGGAYIDFRLHKPASNSTPTYVVEKNTANLGIIEGVLSNGKAASVVARSSVAGQEELRVYRLNPSDADLKSELVGKIEGVEITGQVEARVYGNGYILFDEDFKKVYFFSSLDSLSPSKNLTIERPDSNSLSPTDIVLKDDKWAMLYADTPISDSPPKKSEILLSSGEKLKLDDALVGIEYCGNDAICGLTNTGHLVTYGSKEDSYKEVRRLPGIVQISLSADGKLYLLTDRVVAEYSSETGEAKVVYSEGEYQISGLSVESAVIVTIKGVGDKSRALVLDPKYTDNNIDKLIANLLKSDDVVFSIYKTSIFAALNLPPAPFNSNTGLFSYPESFIRQEEAKIRKLFDDTGINKDKYRLMIPL
ncbi:MAG: hypothetical protein M3Q70_04060 [bacterium]|nr:hypothetical protein [bacterium]